MGVKKKITFVLSDKCTESGHDIKSFQGGSLYATTSSSNGIITEINGVNGNSTTIDKDINSLSKQVEVIYECGDEGGSQKVTLKYTNNYGKEASDSYNVPCGDPNCGSGSTTNNKSGTPTSITWKGLETDDKSSSGWKGLVEFTIQGCQTITGITAICSDDNFKFWDLATGTTTKDKKNDSCTTDKEYSIKIHPVGQNKSGQEKNSKITVWNYDKANNNDTYKIGEISLKQETAYSVTVKINTGIEKITVTINDGTAQNITEETTIWVNKNDVVKWDSVVASGKEITSSGDGKTKSGQKTITANYTISPETGSVYTLKLDATDPGISSIEATYGSTNTSLTATAGETNEVTVSAGTKVSWTTTSKADYKLNTGSGWTAAQASNKTINESVIIKPTTEKLPLLTVDATNEGIAKVVATYSNKSITAYEGEKNTVGVEKNTEVNWTSYAKDGYQLIVGTDYWRANGKQTITSDYTIQPRADQVFKLTLDATNEGIAYIKADFNNDTLTANAGETTYTYIAVGTRVSWSTGIKEGYE